MTVRSHVHYEEIRGCIPRLSGGANRDPSSFSSLLLSNLELSDTEVYEPYIRSGDVVQVHVLACVSRGKGGGLRLMVQFKV